MAFIRCNLSGVKLPDCITLSGITSSTMNPSAIIPNGTPVMYTSGKCIIQTFGYHYADVSGGTIDSKSGKNIDISNKESIEFIANRTDASWNTHYNGNNRYPYGGASTEWTIVLHN